MRYEPDVEIRVCGIPCGAVITRHSEARPMKVTGWGFGDADPTEDEEAEFFLVDRKGYRAKWLEEKVKDWRKLEDEVLEENRRPHRER